MSLTATMPIATLAEQHPIRLQPTICPVRVGTSWRVWRLIEQVAH